MAKPPKPLVAEIYRSRKGWRFRLKGRNGEIVAASQAYSRKHDAKRGAERVLGRPA